MKMMYQAPGAPVEYAFAQLWAPEPEPVEPKAEPKPERGVAVLYDQPDYDDEYGPEGV